MNFVINSPLYTLLSGNIREFVLHVLYILPALFIAVSFHEAAHAWMANRMGDPTAKNLGRLTLDPLKHFDIWGFLMFMLVGIGWGKPVPTNPRNYINYKKANVLVALAGVITNLILSFIFYGIFVLVSDVFNVTNEIVLQILNNIVVLNIVLCFFNLLPVPPLDGHHLVKGFIARISPRFYQVYERYGYFILIGLLVATDLIDIILSFFLTQVITLYRLFFGLFF